MPKLLVAAGLVTSLMLVGCGEGAVEPEAPPPRKSQARSAQMYAGQAMIHSVQSASVEPGRNGSVILTVTGTTPSPGWTGAAFVPRIYASRPSDGVYEIDVIATAPTSPTAAASTLIEVKGDWDRYTDGRVKGVRFMSVTNEVVAMLPAAEAPAS